MQASETKETLNDGAERDVEIEPLHVFQRDGDTVSRWKLSWRERWSAFFHGIVWLHTLGTIVPPTTLTARGTYFETTGTAEEPPADG